MPAPLPFTRGTRHNPELGIRPHKRVIRPRRLSHREDLGKRTKRAASGRALV
jgi:hypothetical protein